MCVFIYLLYTFSLYYYYYSQQNAHVNLNIPRKEPIPPRN